MADVAQGKSSNVDGNSDNDTPAKHVQSTIPRSNLGYENLVFEGGGAKGVSYAGALQYLEEVGLLDKDGNHAVKRFAGTSVGAIVACLLSVGFSVNELKKVLEPEPIKKLTSGGTFFSKLKTFRQMLDYYGINTTASPKTLIGQYIEEKTGNQDITFKQLYRKTGKELCVVVTNVNRLTAEYFHVKRTPDTIVRDAVVMSMSIPGYFMATKSRIGCSKYDDFYVDGGVLCNYPIHCYDGWFLSMDRGDSYFKRVKSLQDFERDIFKGYNPKTLGFLAYADSENQWMRSRFESRDGLLEPPKPAEETSLFRARDFSSQKEKATEKYKQRRLAAEEFIKISNRSKDKLSREEIKEIFEHESLTTEYRKILFKKMSFEEFYGKLESDEDGMVAFTELLDYVESLGVLAGNKYKGYDRKDIKSFKEFSLSLATAMVQHAQFSNLKAEDVDRSVAINTGYVDTLDFDDLEEADKRFLVERGYSAAKAFFEWKEEGGKGRGDDKEEGHDQENKER